MRAAEHVDVNTARELVWPREGWVGVVAGGVGGQLVGIT